MPELDETLETTASVTEQPEHVQADESSTEVQEAPSEPKETPELYAGKYKTVDDLVAAYKHSTAENSRMAQQLAANRPAQPTTPATKAEKEHTPEQLESYKEDWLLELGNAQALAQQATVNGDAAAAEKYRERARQSAQQVRMIDAKLRETTIQSTIGSTKKQAAEARLLGEAKNVISQYSSELVEGTELHTKAIEFMQHYQDMGMDVNSAITQAQAVSMAAQVLGLGSKKVAAVTRKELANSMSAALKSGVTAGAGKAAKTSTAPNYAKMSDAEFIAYKQSIGLST